MLELHILQSIHMYVHVYMCTGWSGLPGRCGFLYPTDPSQPLAGSQDRPAQYQHDGREGSESQGVT